MTIIAVILAGGVGSRMKADRPKQFIEVRGKPVIIHTIENFRKNGKVDGIVTVCLPEWIDRLRHILDDNGMKNIDIVSGGECSHDSIRNGVFHLEGRLKGDDYVIIHDAARPILSQEAIDDLIRVASEYGNACSSLPFYEPVMITDNGIDALKDIPRSNLVRTGAPQMFLFSQILDAYKRAEEDGLHDFVYANLVVAHYRYPIHFSKGLQNNIKITHPEDIELFEALLEIRDSSE